MRKLYTFMFPVAAAFSGISGAQPLTTPGPIPMERFCPRNDDLGALPNNATVGSYEIPREIARASEWILIHVNIYTGTVRPNGARVYEIRSERQSYRRFVHRLYHWGYPGDAVNSSSQDYWMPMPGSGQVQIAMTGGNPITGSFGSNVRLIGYLRNRANEDCL